MCIAIPRTRNLVISGIIVSWFAADCNDNNQISQQIVLKCTFSVQQLKTVLEIRKLIIARCHVNLWYTSCKMFSVLCSTVCSWFLAMIALGMSLLSCLQFHHLCKDLTKKMLPSCLLRISVNMPIGRDVPKNLQVTPSGKPCMSMENTGGKPFLHSSVLLQGIIPKPRRGLPQLWLVKFCRQVSLVNVVFKIIQLCIRFNVQCKLHFWQLCTVVI